MGEQVKIYPIKVLKPFAFVVGVYGDPGEGGPITFSIGFMKIRNGGRVWVNEVFGSDSMSYECFGPMPDFFISSADLAEMLKAHELINADPTSDLKGLLKGVL